MFMTITFSLLFLKCEDSPIIRVDKKKSFPGKLSVSNIELTDQTCLMKMCSVIAVLWIDKGFQKLKIALDDVIIKPSTSLRRRVCSEYSSPNIETVSK